MLEQQIENDLKKAMLVGDKLKVNTLRSVKNALIYAKTAKTKSGELDDAEILQILTKEAAKRQESADLYSRGGYEDRAKVELEEKSLIEKYLPEPMSETELTKLTEDVIGELGASSARDMGRVIAEVKARSEGRAAGAVIAKLVKERLAGA